MTSLSDSQRPSLAACFAVVAATRASLKLLGFRRSIAITKRIAARFSTAERAGSAEEAARTVAMAAALFPGRAVCLEQSIALYLVLRRRGFPAQLRIGVQPYPFRAHAWVELDQRPIFENEDTVQKFVPFPEAFA
jgi:hypothetical protein